MKELNEKLIISLAVVLLAIGGGFYFLFPSQKGVEAKTPNFVKQYTPIDIREGLASNPDWPEAKEQAKGEMFDLFTPPEIFINDKGDFVFRPPYAVSPIGPFGVRLLEINLDPYRFQLEGFVEEDRNDQSKTTILVHSVKDGKSLRLRSKAKLPQYDFEILDWRVDRNFDDDKNTEVTAWLKLEDSLTNRIINLRHDERLYEDNIEIIFEVEKSGEIFVLRGAKSSFYIEDIEYRLDEVDYENYTVLMTKLIPDSEPISETLSIYVPGRDSVDSESDSNNKKSNNSQSIEEVFNSYF